MKAFYSALFLILLHGMAHAQCDDFVLTASDVQPPSCPNAADGAITLSVAGAQGVVSYAWSEVGLSGPAVSGLAPGTYSVTATDDGGCTAVEALVLEATLTADAGPDLEAYCGAGPVSLGGVAQTEIYFSSDITPVEFSDSNQELVPFRGISGEVGFAPAPDSFDAASSDSLYVEIGSATASGGDVVCLPVRVYNFTDIVGAAFTINYDFAHLNFMEVTGLNPNLPGFSEATNIATPNTGLDAGFIILNYFELSLSGVSLSDGSTLFTLCFEVTGISGTSAGPDITYQWTGPNNFTSTEPFPQVAQSGAYTLRVTDSSRPDCWAEDVVEVNMAADIIADAGPDITAYCGQDTVRLGSYQEYEVEIVENNLGISILSGTDEPVPYQLVPGKVGIGGTPSPVNWDTSFNGLTLVWRTVAGMPGDTVCLPLRGYNFTDIGRLLLEVNFGDSSLVYNGFDDYGLPLLGPGNFAQRSAVSAISDWAAPFSDGETLQNGDTLFSICLIITEGRISSTTGPDITYQWTGPNNFTSTELFPQVTESGTYTLRVTDSSRPDCWAEDEVEVRFISDSIGVELRDTLIPCLEQPATLRPTVSGGAGPYTYQWNNGATSDSIFLAASEIPAAFSVTVTSAEGCSGLASGEVTVANNPPPVASITLDQIPYCAGSGLSLVIGANGQGGQAPYTYVWSDGATTANRNRTFPPFSATTTYFVDVIDANGCLSVNGTDSVTVVVNPSPTLDLGPDHYLCTPEQVFLSGPSGAASYDWSDGQATQTIIIQPPQTTPYYLTITNAFGCTATDTVVVFVGLQNLETTSPTCNDNGTPLDPTDDAFTFQATIDGNPGGGWVSNFGATGSYGQTATFGPFSISDGDVTLTVVDGLDPACNTTTVVTAPLPCSTGPACNLQATVQDITCNDNNTPADTTDDTFTLDILVTGGPGAGWVEDSSGLSGDYGVPFTFGPYPADYGHVGLIFLDEDDPSCFDIFDLYTPVPCIIDCQQNPILLNFDVVFPTCAGDANGEALAIVEGGAGGYTYEWSNGATTFDNLNNLPSGDYGLTVTDMLGCQATGSVTLSEPPPLTLDVQVTPVSCRGGNDGSVAIFVTGGTPPYTYVWDFGATTATATGLSAGIYSITVTDANGCSIIGQAEVSEPADGLMAPISIVQQPACPNSADGILSADASGGQPPYEYAWPAGFTGPTHPGLSPGFYSVTVTDAGGCSVVESILLEALLIADAGPVQTLDCNNPTVTLDGSLSATGANIAYEWTGPGGILGNQLNITVSEPGAYILEVTDTSQPGCSAADTVLVAEDFIFPFIDISPNFVSCDSAVLSFPPFVGMQITWTLPGGDTSTGPVLGVTESGWYSIAVTDTTNGCTATGQIQVDIDPSQCATLKGRLVRDTLPDCLPAAAEPGLANWLIVIQGGGEVYYAVTQPGGHYEQSVPIGDYEVYPLLPGPLWLPCEDSYPVSLQQPGEMAMLDIPVQKAEACPALSVDVSIPILRRCWSRSIPIGYCNEGTAAAEGAYIVVTLDDAFTYQSATVPLLSQDGNRFTFDIGDVAIGECGTLYVTVQVSCDAVVGQTLCAEAKIFPNAPCFPASPNWSGASLRVEGGCESGEVQFRVENVGSADMPAPLPCIVIEDGVMLLANPDSIRLNSGEAFTYRFPANGATYRLEVEQEPFHPGHSMPVAVLEGCGANDQGNFSTGFVNQLALDDADPFIDIECREVVGSYDPNDKHGFPRGYGAEHYIYPGTDIEYLVQFQNTGNDTAFLVVIRDTLSEHLDITSVQPGAASHPYAWDIDSNNILVFTFEDILLPDSTTNLEGSQGFVEFKVAQQDGLPLGTVIGNSAAIYFDVNAPIITNTTFHTLGYDFIEVISFIPEIHTPELKVSVMPNPMGEWALLQLEGWPGGEGLFELFDLQGRRLWEQRFSGAAFRFERRGLPAGAYAFRIVDEQGRWGSGRLVIGQK